MLRGPYMESIKGTCAVIVLIVLSMIVGSSCIRVANVQAASTIDELFAKGESLILEKKFNEAIIAFDKVIDISPDYPNAYYNRGRAYRMLNRFEQAIKDFNKAIELDPMDAAKYNNRGLTYMRLGKCELAIEDFNKIIELDKTHFSARVGRAMCRNELKQYELALSDLDVAIDSDPESSIPHQIKAAVYSYMNNAEEACKSIKDADRQRI
jgi:tetratricopeptide (TPR) repeat protein